MSKKQFFILIVPFLLSCVNIQDGTKVLDLNSFKITIPQKWRYVKERYEDSFTGTIITSPPKESLRFDCSSQGYANSLISDEQEYLKKEEWKQGSYFYKTGVTYTTDFNVKKERDAQMKKMGVTDSTLVHVEADPSYETKTKVHLPTIAQKIKFPKADYIADMTYRDSTIYIPIVIPIAIQNHYIKIDTTEKYVIKTIWPKEVTKGLTGIYIYSRSSSFNFQMSGINLSAKDQQLALKAFKTITFKQ